MRRLIFSFLILLQPQVYAANCQTMREIYIENKTTKVWKTVICPGQKLPFHTHQYARVVIPEQDGILQVIYRSGKKEMLKLEKKTPIYLSKEQGKYSHQDLNIGKKPLEVTVIELRKG
ncbi:hypothetical protein ACFORL_09935 [Legionella dresdenensis]|uniref:Cupin domain protein n=1 Tax=Legionella dresdenensis TaxID=450200 RepID=A0ABV8CGM7_9GAMM